MSLLTVTNARQGSENEANAKPICTADRKYDNANKELPSFKYITSLWLHLGLTVLGSNSLKYGHIFGRGAKLV